MQNKKTLKKYEEHTLPENSTIILSQNLLDQVDYLHKVVGKVEWSGVLVYRTVQGSIENYKKFVVEAVEILPMDVGTSGYTEYEIEAADEYVFKNLLERVMLDDDLKIGHIHTHHGMDCFFSGTDMAELHENAPNHNYYLSLIVNFQDYTNWKAKIAQIKTMKTKGSAVYSYKGTNGTVEEKVSLNGEKEIMSLINLKIEPETTLEDEFIKRVKELKTEQDKSVKQKPLTGNTDWTGYYGKPTEQATLFDVLNESLAPDSDDLSRIFVDVSEESITMFSLKLLAQSTEPLGTLENTLSVLDQAFLSEEYGAMDYYMETIVDNFDALYLEHFKTTPSTVSKKLVVEKVAEVLEKFEEKYNYTSALVETTIDTLRLDIILEQE